MHPSRFLPLALGVDERAHERAEAWRRLHRRPDAPAPAPRHAAQMSRRARAGRALLAALALIGARRKPIRVARDG